MAKYADMILNGKKNVTDAQAVLQAIENILKTRVGERPFNREFGSHLEDYLFEPFSFVTSRLIFSEIKRSIYRWEDRVEIMPESDVKLDYDNRRYEVVLFLKIKGLPDIVTYNDSLIPKEKE